jgi:hypothetical protein
MNRTGGKSVFDLPNIHTEDLIPVSVKDGISVSNINYRQAEERELAFLRKLITLNKENNEQL